MAQKADTTIKELEARMFAIGNVSQKFMDTVAVPMRQAIDRPNKLNVAMMMFRLPMEAAAAGFDVHIVQRDDCWHLEIKHRIDDECEFHVYGKAKSLFAAVVQVTDDASQTLGRLARETKTLMQAEIQQAAPAA